MSTTDETQPLDIDLRIVHVPWQSANEQCPRHRRALVACCAEPWQALSWAPRGGGSTRSTTYCCLEVRNSDLPVGVDPNTVLDRFVTALELESPVATLTSANIDAYCTSQASEAGITAFVLVTTGFANALRVGELTAARSAHHTPDTINLACWLNRRLTLEAQLEAVSIITQARTLAMLEAKIESSDHSGFATGTGTDCVVLFTRPQEHARPQRLDSAESEVLSYAGMHTSVGRVIGHAVRRAMKDATARWTKKHGSSLIAKLDANDHD